MTDEEKSIMEEWTVTQEEAEAEIYANEKHCSNCINFGDCVEIAIEDRCKTYRECYTYYLDGLAEGRKEKCLEQNKDGTIRPCEVVKENEELEDIRNHQVRIINNDTIRIEKLEKENSILKNIISTILDKDDICYICQMKGQVLPECMRMENSECLENMISLWSK